MTRESLFRAETEQARATAWLGHIVLIGPVSFAFLAAAAFAMTLALGTFFVFGEYTRKARINGVLAPAQGVVRVVALQSGIVETLHAAEGEAIAQDAPLLAIGDGRADRAREEVGRAFQSRLDARGQALARQRRHAEAALASEQASMQERLDGFGREIRQAEAEMDVQLARLAVSRNAVRRSRDLAAMGFLSPAAAEHEEDGAAEQGARFESLRRTRIALERERASLEHEMQTSHWRARAQLDALDLQRASLDQERLERDLQYHATVVAPLSGTIATVLVERGQMVAAGTPLVAIIPEGAELEAHLFSPSRSIGFVRPGQEVRLRYLAYPHQKFGMQKAMVKGIARHPMLPAELGFTPPDNSREPLYRIKTILDAQSITAYGREEPLQAGMQVEADVLLDRRRLIEWIFEPLLSLAGRA